MDYKYLDKAEYSDIPLLKIEDSKNNLPFFIIKMDRCCQNEHRHEFVQIIYMWKGRPKHVINKNVFDVYKGDIFVIPPYIPHYFINEYHEQFELVEFEFIPEFINENFSPKVMENSFMDFAYLEPFLVTENMIKPQLNIVGSLQREVESTFDRILREYNTRESDFELLIKALLLNLLVLVGREYKKGISDMESKRLMDRHRDALYDAIKYVNENYTRDITPDDAAKVALMSHSYFRYLFKQMTGKTFTEYVNHMKIEKAVELLKTMPEKRVIDICCEVGCNNVNHFNRVFRKETGTTPMKIRNRNVRM